MLSWTRPTPAQTDALFADLRRRDPRGHAIHTAFAAIFCALATFPTTFLEVAGIVAIVVATVRLTTHHRILGPLVWEWPIRLMLAWALWLSLSVLWSVDRGRWMDDLDALRWALAPLVLWPVIDRRRTLIAALVVGVAIGQLSQVAHGLGRALDLSWLTWNRLPGRNSGWWDPVVGGSILVAALGVHLGGAMLGRRGRQRALGAVGALACLVGIAATGTRGAWIAAAGLLVLTMGLAAWRTRPRRRLIAPALAALAAAAALAAVAALTPAGDGVRSRFERGVREARLALAERRFNTDTGLRVAMNLWAIDAVRARPLLGVGAGGYHRFAMDRRAAMLQEARASSGNGDAPPRGRRARTREPHRHAHSWPLHAAATTGLIGLAIMGALVGLSIRGGLTRRSADAACPSPGMPSSSPSPSSLQTVGAPRHRQRGRCHARDPEHGYDAGPALGLVGLVLAGAFDTIHVNQQTAAVLFILITLCLPGRPRAVDRVGLRVP